MRPDTRDTVELQTPWQFAVDPSGDGERLQFFARAYDASGWQEVAVPGAFDGYGENMSFYQGPAWYRKPFTVPEAWRGRRVSLRFDGVNYRAMAWLNGDYLGENRDPFLPFEFDVGKSLTWDGVNTLSVRVDNTCYPEDLPGNHIGWRNVGGILRKVTLTATNPLYVDAIRITATADGGFDLKGEVKGGDGERADLSLGVAIRRDGAPNESVHTFKARTLRRKADGSRRFNVRQVIAGIRPWSPQHPALYVARVDLLQDGQVVDSVDTRFGFRTVEARGARLFLNGEQVFLTGFNRHEDSPRTFAALDVETMQNDLRMMKDAGCNFLRLCHYPHDASELDFCDEIGLLAKCEVPLYFWTDSKAGRKYQRPRANAAARQLRTLVARDRNHPSVIIWSVSNETHEEVKQVTADNKRLIRAVRKLDSSRLAVHVSNRWHQGGCFDEDDLICVNAYPSLWPGIAPDADWKAAGTFWREALANIHARYPDKPVLVTEFGCLSVDAQATGQFSPGYYAKALETEFPVLATCDFVCGATIWCWADHTWPHHNFLNSVAISPFGVLTRSRRPLAQFWAARRLFREKQGIRDPPPAAPPSTKPAIVGITMVREHLDNIPHAPVPEGYRIRTMTPDDAGIWGDIWQDAEQARHINRRNLLQDFGNNLPALAWRGFMIEAPSGVAAGTIAAWMNPAGRWKDYGRIHYLAVRREFQGKGLGKVLLSHALTVMKQWHDRAVLDTQSNRPGAIALYEKYGFRIVEQA